MGTVKEIPPGYLDTIERGEDPETLNHRTDSSLWRVITRYFEKN